MWNTSRHSRHWLKSTPADPVGAGRRLHAETEPCGHTTVLAVRGSIDAYTLTRWQRLLHSTISATSADGGRYLIVDLTDVEFLSLRAVLTMAECTGYARRRGVAVSVVDAHPYAMAGRVTEIAGLSRWLPVYPEFVAALAATKTDAPPLAQSISGSHHPGHSQGRTRRRRRPWFTSTPTARS